MPMRWKRGFSPYEWNFFRILQLGPRAKPKQILHQARNVNRRLDAGKAIEIGGQPLETQAVSDASTKLRDPAAVAEELLLVHAPAQKQPSAGASDLLPQLEDWAAACGTSFPPRLKTPACVLWFAPPPGRADAELPPWRALGLVDAGQVEDLQHDMVFDS